jgi:ribulose-phosphate 3-epimerase
MPLIAPALVSADFARLGEALEMIRAAGARMIHVDVADGHFVPDLTVGQPVIASLRHATDLELDVHLLVERPERYVTDFVNAGADRVSVHPEATPQLHHALELIRKCGGKAGVALNPATSVESIGGALSDLDFLTILCADLAGEGGLREQAFIPGSVSKIETAAEIRDSHHLNFAVEAEGAIGLNNIGALIHVGADILVAGSAIFLDGSPKSRLSEMVRLAAETRGRQSI